MDETSNDVLWERNMMILLAANLFNHFGIYGGPRDEEEECGWYIHDGMKYISLFGGEIIFNVSDDFNVGNLPEIEENGVFQTVEERKAKIKKVLFDKDTLVPF